MDLRPLGLLGSIAALAGIRGASNTLLLKPEASAELAQMIRTAKEAIPSSLLLPLSDNRLVIGTGWKRLLQ